MRVAALVLLALLAAGCAAPAPACTTGGEYRNLDGTMRLCVPPGWEAAEHVYGREVMLFSPSEGPSDPFQENINVGRQAVAANVTLERYVEATVADLDALDNFTFIGRRPDTLGPMRGERLAYSAVIDQFGVRVNVTTVQVIAFHGTTAHVMTGVWQAGREAAYQAAFDSVAASYRPLR